MGENSLVPENMANAESERVVTFDIFENALLDDSENLLSTLTEDEQNEVDNVVTLLEIAKEDSMQDFENETNLLRHNPIDNTELDRLAGKNNALSTSYQTKWSVAVMKGQYFCFIFE